MVSEKLRTSENVFVVLTRHQHNCRVRDMMWSVLGCNCGAEGDPVRTTVIRAENIVTDAGDTYYAQKGAGEAVTNDFNRLTITTANASTPGKTSDSGDITAPPSGGTKAFDATYPRTSDPDTDNPGTTGADIVTFRASYGTGDANDPAITDVTIHLSSSTLGSGSDPLLMHAEFGASFPKTASDTLKVYVNHRFNGV